MRVLRTTRNIRFSESRQLYERSDPSPHTRRHTREVVLQDQHIRMTGSSFRGTVSSIEVKSTCSNSPAHCRLEAAGCNRRSCFELAATTTFPDTITEVPGHTWPPERSCIREATGIGLGVPPRDGNRPLLHSGAFEAPQTERWSPWQARYWSCDTGGRS